jgi:chromosome segregation ATPase
VVSVADASLQPAVNAALQERCNLASTLVVSDRATAAAVIEHFRQNKVGTVNCKILSELQQQRTSNSVPAAAAAAGCTPVLQLLQYNRQAVPGLQPLLEQLLGGWLLVESREVALRLLHLRQSMVTRWVL